MKNRVQEAYNKLSKIVENEKKELDKILQGAQLLADLLTAEEKNGQSREQSEVEHSQSGMEEEAGRGEVSPLRPAPGQLP